MREYLRTSTTVVNAYTMPIARPYLSDLKAQLRARGFGNQPLIMLSSGGVVGAEVAGRFPVRMIESGPAAGALVASYLAEELGIDQLMSFDMGGTTAKACLIQDRRPLVTGAFEVDRRYRFKPGSGIPVTVPAIDMIEIGAGGGSIARVDDLGLLKVGPDSAGSEPGPVCYGRGGREPTVTDADLALGLLSPSSFLGGEMKLDAAGAMEALSGVGEKLGISSDEAALGIYRIVGESMASAVRAHATDRGTDPRGFPLLAFGGAGGLHACYVGELLESESVLFPPMASVLSAFGALVTPARLDLVRGALGQLDNLDWSRVKALVDEMEGEGRQALVEAGIAPCGGALHLRRGHALLRPSERGHGRACGRSENRASNRKPPRELRESLRGALRNPARRHERGSGELANERPWTARESRSPRGASLRAGEAQGRTPRALRERPRERRGVRSGSSRGGTNARRTGTGRGARHHDRPPARLAGGGETARRPRSDETLIT